MFRFLCCFVFLTYVAFRIRIKKTILAMDPSLWVMAEAIFNLISSFVMSLYHKRYKINISNVNQFSKPHM